MAIQARLPTAAVAPGLYSPWYTKPPKRTGAHARVERLTVGAASPISTSPSVVGAAAVTRAKRGAPPRGRVRQRLACHKL